ncbi:MAG: SDR family oxidoreductase [Phycisphaerae bacterium]
MKRDSATTFMTGATGLLGHYVLRDLLERGRRVAAMLRPPVEASAQRLCGLLTEVGLDPEDYIRRDRLVLVEGALPDDLPECSWGRTDDILSCAASLQLFTNGNDEPYATNVRGTRRLLAWARRHKVRRIAAVSTAYVCGSYTESVAEVFHHPQPEFKTEYERSKWLAERELSAWGEAPGHVLTVMRPSFLVGDSQTGRTTQFGGFYQLARMVSILKDGYADGDEDTTTYVPLRIPGDAEGSQNFVPVDFASRLIAEIVLDPRLHGRIYHLTDPRPPTNGHVKRCLEDYFKIDGGYFINPAEVRDDHTPAEALLWQGYQVMTPRVTHNPVFRLDNTREVMDAIGLEFPELSRERVFTLLDYAVARHWGLRAARALA